MRLWKAVPQRWRYRRGIRFIVTSVLYRGPLTPNGRIPGDYTPAEWDAIRASARAWHAANVEEQP